MEEAQAHAGAAADAVQHAYLFGPAGGADLTGGFGYVPEGTTVAMPLIALHGVVLFPGMTLPLLSDGALVRRALSAPPPATRLLYVVCAHRSVGCTAEVRRAALQGDGAEVWHVVALGRQRARIDYAAIGDANNLSRLRVPVVALGDGDAGPVPRPLRAHATFWPPWASKPFDAAALAEHVAGLVERVLLPGAGAAHSSPAALAYYVASNLPLGTAARAALLEAPNVADRLRRLATQLAALDALACACGAPLARVRDAFVSTEEGNGAAFVNPHGIVHELATFRRVELATVGAYGERSTEFSWFQGYAWTTAACTRCGEHLGWRFDAAERGREPRMFWGLRRAALVATDAARATLLPLAAAAAAAAGGGGEPAREASLQAAAGDDEDEGGTGAQEGGAPGPDGGGINGMQSWRL